jgi:cytochrome b6-f complex iron-sulfur subunit
LDVLLGGTFVGTGAVFAGSVLNYLWPRQHGSGGTATQLEVGDEKDLPVGHGKVYAYKDTTVLVVHTPEGVRGYSAVCTHLGCIVAWDEKKKQITCPCHAAVFDTNGNVVSGPPPAPLPTMKAAISNGKIIVGGV